jgi:hypothetical protein
MGWVIALVIIIGVVALDVTMLNNNKQEEAPNTPYARSAHLFNSTERSFLQILDRVVGDNARIFGKVRVADVVMPGDGMTGSNWKEAYHKASSHRFDFLLCNRNDLSVICAIALDNGTPHLLGTSNQTAFLRQVCHAAGVPLIHVPVTIASAIDEVRKLLAPHLGPYLSASTNEA